VKILITGVTGFLGGRLGSYWSDLGHVVTGTGRRVEARGQEVFRVFEFTLGERIDGRELVGQDAIIHCAYDSRASVEVNVVGTKNVCLAAEEAGSPWQVFIGSYAARPQSVASYGRIKYELETFFLERGHTVVRPGLVVGNGGMFQRNMDSIIRSPVIPLLDGGKDPIPVIGITDFVRAMAVLLNQRRPGAFNLFNRDLIPMRTFVDTVARLAGRKPLRVPVPLKLALLLVTIATKLGVSLPFATDNIRSLKQSLPGVYQSDLEALIPNTLSFEAMVESAFQARLQSGDRTAPPFR